MRLRALIGPAALLAIGAGVFLFTHEGGAAASYYAQGIHDDELFLKTEEDNDYQRAIANLKQAVILDPNNATYFYGLGTAYAHGGEFKEARDCFIMALVLRPDFKAAQNNLEIVAAELAEREKK